MIFVLLLVAGCTRAAPCESDSHDQNWPAALVSCGQAYAKSASPFDGIRLAVARFYHGEPDAAAALAATLVRGPRAGRALYLLGLVDNQLGHLEAAQVHLSTAAALHAMAGEHGELARDTMELAGVWRKKGQYRAGLAAASTSRTAALRAGDRKLEAYADFARADLLRRIGDRQAAERAMQAALEAAPDPATRAWILVEAGLVYIDQVQPALAAPALEEARAIATGKPDMRRVLVAAELNLAWIARHDQRFADAIDHLDAAAKAGVSHLNVIKERAQVDYERRQYDAAALELITTELIGLDAQWSWYVPYTLGLVEERRGHPEAAERAYRRAMAAVGRLRQGAGRHEPHVIASHRLPYHGLIGVLAGRGDWAEALAVVAALDADQLVAAQVAPGQMVPTGDLRPVPGSRGVEGDATAADGADDAGASGAPRAAVVTPELLRAWRDRDLVVLVRGGERMWRLDVRGGEVVGHDVGAPDALEELADRLDADPGDAEAAHGLLAAIVPDAPSDRPLDVLLVGRIARASLAALRSRRPLVRVLGLRGQAPSAERSDRVVVIGDPQGNLPSAADEARWVGRQLGVSPIIGRAATRSVLAQARGARLLHIAAHSTPAESGAFLVFADGAVTAADIAAVRPAPRFVVLASCGSAAARDEGGWGSLAAAFLGAGAEAVVATQTSVKDEAAAALVQRFYQLGGATRPVEALAAAQAELAGTMAVRDWATFTIVAAPPP